MPHPRTMVTELGTGLGMLGLDRIEDALASRPAVMRSLSPEDWDRLSALRAGGAFDAEFHAAWQNGRAFLAARDGLRERRPEVVEWKGAVRAPGDEVAPVDLRVDHVYLVSCKYLSNILFNVGPGHLFDDLLFGGQSRRGRSEGNDWFAEVAPDRYQELYAVVRRSVRESGGETATTSGAGRGASSVSQSLPGLGRAAGAGTAGTEMDVTEVAAPALGQLPDRAIELTSSHREALSRYLRSGWPADAKAAYVALSAEVAQASVTRWRAALGGGGGGRGGTGEAMLWRLLRMGSTPYFVLGSSANRTLRLRIATPWDWRQVYALVRLEIFAQAGGQPRVGWAAEVRQRASGQVQQVAGHIEVRWSHGRFSGPPEAKGYVDTPHHLVPGYFPLQ
ncbi:MAG TPA: hypothetical protein VND70_00140 [Acidimicrobiales bacterium]|nr:hypothetical protein [Acidimicrobiales bacterium]